MTKANEPAFPINEKNDDGTHFVTVTGLTKREYFAATTKVMKANFTTIDEVAKFVGVEILEELDAIAIIELDAKVIAKLKVLHADALIAELAKTDVENGL